jgi:hypothetical protein
MAFTDIDEMGDTFANVSQRTGASGSWDDLMVVQGLVWSLWRAGGQDRAPRRSKDAGGRR